MTDQREPDYFNVTTLWLQLFLSLLLVAAGCSKLYVSGVLNPWSDEDSVTAIYAMGVLWLVFGLLFLYLFFRKGAIR